MFLPVVVLLTLLSTPYTKAFPPERLPYSTESIHKENRQAAYPTDFYGVDVSQKYDASHFKCLRDLNLRFAIVRCYQSVGHVDPNCASNVKAAHAGGMDSVHAYMFPCPKCGNPSGQMKDLLAYWQANKVDVKRLWLDIEGAQYWLGDTQKNRAFYTALVDTCRSLNLVCGVYSSSSQWSAIFGSGFSYGSEYPLWYAHYDNTPSFDDFHEFGSWSKPTIKQFSDKGSKCGVSYDISWSANLPSLMAGANNQTTITAKKQRQMAI